MQTKNPNPYEEQQFWMLIASIIFALLITRWAIYLVK